MRQLSPKEAAALRRLQDELIEAGVQFGWRPHVPISAELPPHVTLSYLKSQLVPEYAGEFRSIVNTLCGFNPADLPTEEIIRG